MSTDPVPPQGASDAGAHPGRPAPDEVCGELGRGLAQLFRVAGRAKGRMIGHNQGLEWSTFAVLIPLIESGPLRSSALAEAIHLDPSRVSRMISHVIDLGLVAKRADPADGRAAILHITAEGERVFRELRRQRDEYIATVTSNWSEHDRRTLATLMCRLARDFADTMHADHPVPPKLEDA